MNRLGLIHPSSLTRKETQDQGSLYQAFSSQIETLLNGSKVTYKLSSTESLVGPYGILLHTPLLGRSYLDFANAIYDLAGLSARTREIVALVVAAHERVIFQLYAHGRLAQSQGLSDTEINSLCAGLCASSLPTEDRTVYELARELCVGSGHLSDGLWQQGVGVLGLARASAVVHCVGFQRYVVTILRGFDGQVPVVTERLESQAYQSGAFGGA